MREETAKTLKRTGTHNSTTHPNEYPKLAPATVAVSTAAGSRSAAPAMIPGKILPARPLKELRELPEIDSEAPARRRIPMPNRTRHRIRSGGNSGGLTGKKNCQDCQDCQRSPGL